MASQDELWRKFLTKILVSPFNFVMSYHAIVSHRFLKKAIIMTFWFPRRHLKLAFPILSWVLLVACIPAMSLADEQEDFFEQRIRPLLVSKCESCHSEATGKTHGNLALDSLSGWSRGGDSGPAIVPGNADESLFVKAIRYSEDGPQMPPHDAGGPLLESEVALLVEWVNRGAPDPRISEAKRGGLTESQIRNWWSFQPLLQSQVPEEFAISYGHETGGNEVDYFVGERLRSANLSMSSEADRRTLIRRATYDLHGLPPTYEEVVSFVENTSSTAYEELIERLLQSPRYGERWGRHWLDLVRYADTAGENSDHPLPHAWRYRNWVIDAINKDMPYDQFLSQQIAGDILAMQGSDADYSSKIIATGFWALARRFDHDSDKFMHLTHEDGIDTLGKAFLGLTIGCARCHDHKYDAITAKDYYSLYGILASTKFAFPGCEAKQQPRDLVPLESPALWEERVKPYQDRLAAMDAELQELAARQTQLASSIQNRFATNREVLSTGEIAEGGEGAFSLDEKGIEVHEGELLLLSITPLGNHGADSTLVEWEISQADGEHTWRASEDLLDDLLAGNPHADQFGNALVWWMLDARNQPLPLSEPVRDLSGNAGIHVWRSGETPSVFVNSGTSDVTIWTPLSSRSLFAHPGPDGNVAIGWLSPVSGKVSIKGRLKDVHPGGPNGVGWILERFAESYQEQMTELAELSRQRPRLEQQRSEWMRNAPAQNVGYAVVEGTPGDASIQLKGDPEKLGDPVPRRWLEILGGEPIADPTTSGRLDLAQWIASPNNPLTARVMANRIWLHHFGKGLVKTPNDFGTRGILPTHPELLDWLANRLIRDGWSQKALHRVIMLSKTYRQSSESTDTGLETDVSNDLYWRYDRRRLSAEELRDSLLFASQQLDLSIGGPHDIPPAESWSYTQHVPFSGVAATNLRSVYQINIRNRRDPFLALFDGADPNATTPLRQVTTVPTQSLYFLNDPTFHENAERLADRVLADASAHAGNATSDDSERLELLYKIVLQRSPTLEEQQAAATFFASYSTAIEDASIESRSRVLWAAWSRVLMASNEFFYLD